ncbi:MAG TPA: preprotein translocase subunit SecE [Solirubrobacterales bacterium]|nr:preprotein translocase subunit SecE [Solirubrobacterales bacterium]
MAKTRAQRKAERRAREARAAREAQSDRGSDSRAQKRTQVPESAEVVEAELAEHGADLESLKGAPPEEAAAQEALAETAEELPAPAPSRADVGAPPEAAPDRISRRERRREEKEREQRRKESEKRRQVAAQPQERQRGAVAGFLVSCWAELKRVQWPDRDTLVQASAVTLVFIAIAAAYLGALDALFNFLVQRLL